MSTQNTVTLSREPASDEQETPKVDAVAATRGLSTEAFLEKRRSSQSAYIFDLRPSEAYDAGHLPGAYSLPFAHVEANLHRLPFSGDLLFYDGGEGTVFQVANLLEDNGFNDHWHATDSLDKLIEAIRTSPSEIHYESLSPADRAAKVEEILDSKVREFLAKDGGGMEVLGIEENKVMVSYHGACGSCSSSTAGTLRFIQGVLTINLNHEIEVVPVEA